VVFARRMFPALSHLFFRDFFWQTGLDPVFLKLLGLFAAFWDRLHLAENR